MNFWNFPWRFKQSIVIGVGLLITGFLLETSTGRGLKAPSWPYNIYLLIITVASIGVMHFFRNKLRVIQWLSQIPASLTSIFMLSFLSIFIGIIPQGNESIPLGMGQVTSSWPFAISTLFLIISLGLVVCRRATPLNKQNIGFLLNHLGLFLIVVTFAFGSSDIIRLKIKLQRGSVTFGGIDKDTNTSVELPFAMELIDFNIEEFEPFLTLIDSNREVHNSNKNRLVFAKDKSAYVLDDWSVKVITHYRYSKKFAGQYKPINDVGSVTAVEVKVFNKELNIEKTGWISHSSKLHTAETLPLTPKLSLAMLNPRVKKFSSEVKILDPATKQSFEKTIEVNKPLKFGKWNFYQVTYDKVMGKWSKTSILEAVYDPWLPSMYTGILILLIGSLYMMLAGRSRD